MSVATPRVIVVGGGPVGLTAAHALSRAGIDFVLLESRSAIVLEAGSNLVLTPTGLRALSQLGILPALNELSTPLAKFQRFDHQGRDIGDTMFFTYVEKNHGCFPRVISRRDLMQSLWDALPADAQAKLHPNKRVSGVRATAGGVVVECRDGTAYEGTLVIGADGAHSTVRGHMATMAGAGDGTDAAGAAPETPYLTTYRCFWMRFPVLPGMAPGDATETHGPVATTQFFAGATSAVAGLYEKLAAPTRAPPRYTAADEAALVARWGHLPLTRGGGVTLADAYRHAAQTGLVNLEEGVVPDWSRAGRAVLVGDAAHKFTPSTGAGCNTGIVDVVVLANGLRRAFDEAAARANAHAGTPAAPDAAALDAVFRAYQAARQAAADTGCAAAGRATAMATWASSLQKLVDLYVFSQTLVQRAFVNRAAAAVAQTPVFDYIEGSEEIVGSVAWANPIPGPATSKAF